MRPVILRFFMQFYINYFLRLEPFMEHRNYINPCLCLSDSSIRLLMPSLLLAIPKMSIVIRAYIKKEKRLCVCNKHVISFVMMIIVHMYYTSVLPFLIQYQSYLRY
ncbi:hypothetical protein PAEPH01_1325 [Pancytospora epiphaga]|nr:hypothetical protein PAEPH01_1325 [Pancytospora epiphaga]